VAVFFSSHHPASDYLAPAVVGAPDSDELWTTTLQSPAERIVRRQTIPARIGPGALRLRVRFSWDPKALQDGAPPPMVAARVNGLELGALAAPADLDEPWCCNLFWPLSVGAVAGGTTAEIEIWMPVRDPRVRFIAQNNPYAARLGGSGSLFYDGRQLLPGVPHSFSGTIRDGFAHVWLEPNA
jgi:hypothetical protein